MPVLRKRPELTPQRFAQLGFRLAVLEPGKPSGLYHAESAQEDFLVLEGECVATVEGEQRRLERWDFLHCPPGTRHVFVGAGGGQCLLLMVGARVADGTIDYPEQKTTSPRQAYAGFPHWQPGSRPPLP